jgi:hypothetical protein
MRYETFAVAYYGCMSHALHLRQTQQSLNFGFKINLDGFVKPVSSGQRFFYFIGTFISSMIIFFNNQNKLKASTCQGPFDG